MVVIAGRNPPGFGRSEPPDGFRQDVAGHAAFIGGALDPIGWRASRCSAPASCRAIAARGFGC
jgi:hypothetical protein